jgi:hypothetical protein
MPAAGFGRSFVRPVWASAHGVPLPISDSDSMEGVRSKWAVEEQAAIKS